MIIFITIIIIIIIVLIITINITISNIIIFITIIIITKNYGNLSCLIGKITTLTFLLTYSYITTFPRPLPLYQVHIIFVLTLIVNIKNC